MEIKRDHMNQLVKSHVLDGEILNAYDCVRVFIATHPLYQTRIELSIPAGITTRELIDIAIAQSHSPYEADSFVIHGEQGVIPQNMWDHVRPKAKTTLVMRPTPRGPLIGIFGAIFGALGGSLGGIFGAGFFGKLLMAVIGIGLKFLMNALFAPKPKKEEQIETKPSYSITGSRNESSPWGPIPVILGTHRVVPFLAGSPYTETVGTEQYLRMLFVVGYGPLTISQIKIGETAIETFEDVTWQVRSGYSGDTPTSIYPRQVVQEDLGIELKSVDGYHQRTTAEDVTEIQIDIVWPGGLLFIGSSGDRLNMVSKIQWGYRLVGGGAWTDRPLFIMHAKTQDIIRRTFRVPVAAGQYEVRVLKANADTVATGGAFVFQDVQWTALRGFRVGEPIEALKPVAVIAVRIRASDQLNGVIDTLNCIAQSKVTSFNGSTWVADTFSARPADLFRWVLQSPANARPEPTARIDLVALQGWWGYAGPQGFSYNKVITSVSSVLETLFEIAAAGRATPIFKDGKWSVVWDEQNLPISQLFTPRNSWDFEFNIEYRDIPHALRVRFTNKDKGYADDEVIVYDDGFTKANATKFESINFPGVVDHDSNWKHARFTLAQARLRPATYTLMCGWEGAVLIRGDRIKVAHDVMLVGLGWGRVKAVAGQTFTSDEIMTLSAANPTYGFSFRKADGTYALRTCPGASGEFTQITLTGTSTMPAVGDLFAYGISGLDTQVYRVLGIEPQPDLQFRLTLVDDGLAIATADTGIIPEFTGGISQPIDPFTLPPINLLLTDFGYEESGVFYEAIMADWELPRAGRTLAVQIQYRSEEDLVWRTVGSVAPEVTVFTIRRLLPGLYTVRVRAVFRNNTFSAWNTSAVYNAQALHSGPADVANFKISSIGESSNLSWNPVSIISGGAVVYEIRFSNLLTGATWNASAPLLQGVSGTSVQVQTMVGTYLIKAKAPNGLLSVNATLIVSNVLDILGLNIIATLVESPSYSGVHDQTAITDGSLRLSGRNVMANWATLSSVTSLQVGDGDPDSVGFFIDGIYYFANSLDLGAIFTSRLTWDITVGGFSYSSVMSTWISLATMGKMDPSSPEDWSVELQYRSSQVGLAGPWSDWQQFVVGDVTARAFEFRLLLFGKIETDPDTGIEHSTISPSVSALTVHVDMPDRIDKGEDITCPIGGMDVVYPAPFNAVPAVNVTPQNMATGDYVSITAKTVDKFHIQMFNASDVAIAGRTFDWIAKGYGRIFV